MPAWWSTPIRVRPISRAHGDNVAMYISEVPFWTHRILWQLLFSGKFDKFPNLRYAVVECGSFWVGDLLWKADVNFGASFKVRRWVPG
ncbi:MAG: hypothetical protein Ct9H300mP12_04530 [Acidimicrobiales bacterium]|nr:MAG: hypothetical protein Ct9H300mP12_04530 [Acidimicrobiales bacterium]